MKSIITLGLLILSSNSFAQRAKPIKDTLSVKPPLKERTQTYNNAIRKPAYLNKLNKDTTQFAKSPLYLVKLDGQANYYTVMPQLGLIEQSDIVQMEILKDKMADEQFHEKGKNGVIIITLKKETDLLTMDQLFDRFNIKKKFKNLPLFLNNNITAKLTDMVFAVKNIKSVSVEKEKGTGLKYLSIVSTDSAINIRGSDFKIRGGAKS